MAGIPAELIYRIDRIFLRPRVGGRESAPAYSEWEYRTGMALVERYPAYFGGIGGGRLLDIGCGLGGKTVVYAEKGAGALVTGVDIDPLNCAGAASFAGVRGRRIDVACGDARALPFRDGSFDFVVANDSMEHFSDPAKALGEIARVTRKGGS
ncbi:MAG: class I SAM-dependent methyltransferase, partial [Candidatus Krumholzibacteria bacterium]|nr:class I SAM-dependent methyltransferase [Candidatus Krumholzibacteria bacterium]